MINYRAWIAATAGPAQSQIRSDCETGVSVWTMRHRTIITTRTLAPVTIHNLNAALWASCSHGEYYSRPCNWAHGTRTHTFRVADSRLVANDVVMSRSAPPSTWLSEQLKFVFPMIGFVVCAFCTELLLDYSPTSYEMLLRGMPGF